MSFIEGKIQLAQRLVTWPTNAKTMLFPNSAVPPSFEEGPRKRIRNTGVENDGNFEITLYTYIYGLYQNGGP